MTIYPRRIDPRIVRSFLMVLLLDGLRSGESTNVQRRGEFYRREGSPATGMQEERNGPRPSIHRRRRPRDKTRQLHSEEKRENPLRNARDLSAPASASRASGMSGVGF